MPSAGARLPRRARISLPLPNSGPRGFACFVSRPFSYLALVGRDHQEDEKSLSYAGQAPGWRPFEAAELPRIREEDPPPLRNAPPEGRPQARRHPQWPERRPAPCREAWDGRHLPAESL